MMNPLTWLARRRFPYEPLVIVEISRNRLIHNLNEFKKIAPHGLVAPVLKSNAYGHGLFQVACILEKNAKQAASGVIPFFVVDSYFEAVALRSRGIRTHLLIIGYARHETILTSRLHDISYTVSSLDQLRKIKNAGHPVLIHLKIDTGMRRQGILEEEMETASNLIAGNAFLILKGICSHLCDSDNPDSSFTKAQIQFWNRAVKYFKARFPTLEYLHLSATDGHRYARDIDANVSRLGIGLYGLADENVFSPKLDLRPVMKMKTVIAGIKKLRQDETVGYGNAFRADRDMIIATIPVGYFEGVDRRLSDNGFVEVEIKSDIGSEKILCPIIGRVSMNITSIDVSRLSHSEIDMPVIVISDNAAGDNSIQSIAKRCGTIPYEIAARVAAHLKRVIVE